MMIKNQWRIRDIGESDFGLIGCEACFYFDKIWESELHWNFYHREYHIGRLFKLMDEIVNPEEFKKKREGADFSQCRGP